MKEYQAIFEIEDIEAKLLKSIVTETGKLKDYTTTEIVENKIIITSKKYSHFVATILNMLRILKSFETIDRVIKDGERKSST